MTIEDWFFGIRNDPKKLARVFKLGWLIAYSMLILGAFIIIWAFLQ